jgi:serine/threonine protein kinase
MAKPKAKPREQRMSALTETQIMEKLRAVVSSGDPNSSYTKIKKVGQGASGSVYVARYTNPIPLRTKMANGTQIVQGHKVAIKQMDLANQPRKELIVNEILVMKESQHPNIVNFLDSYLVRGNELWVVMEFMEGGALTDVIDHNTLSEEQISCISLEVPPPPAVLNIDMQRIRTSALEEYHSQRYQIRQRPPFIQRHRQNHRFWLLRKTHGTEIKTSNHGWNTVLDGSRSRQTKGIRCKSRYLVVGYHGN